MSRTNETAKLSHEALALVAARFKILADPMRLRILHALQSGELSVTEIADAVESTQPNVSQHLRILQEAGFIARRQEGNHVYCSIADPTVFDLCDLVCNSLRQRVEEQAGAIGRPVRTGRQRS